MGGVFAKLLSSLAGENEIKIAMVGLEGAGKTTILNKLKLGEIVTTTPTAGFTVETVKYNNISFTVWDVGGQNRALWKPYLQNTQGLIFVVDSNDKTRLSDAKSELTQILSEDDLKNIPSLVFANKQDLPSAYSQNVVTVKLDLRAVANRQWFIQASAATSGDGLYEGLDWLSKKLKN